MSQTGQGSAAREPSRVAIVGSGPAGLMAAEVLSAAGVPVTLFEARKGPSWKLYIAGSSGLNISNSQPLPLMLTHYSGPSAVWEAILSAFTPQDWLGFIETELGLGAFLGTSQRYFVETMHAASLIRNWRRRLEARGVAWVLGQRCSSVNPTAEGWRLSFADGPDRDFIGVGFALGGASWESELPTWPEIFAARGAQLEPFSPANVGYEVTWPPGFLQEAEGQPLKNISLASPRGEKRGDLIVTSYGLEGTPIYFLGHQGLVHIDLKPDLSAEELKDKLSRPQRENRSLLRRAEKILRLAPASQALLYHTLPEAARSDLLLFVAHIKALPLQLLRPRPLSEAISSRGGVSWESVTANLMLQNHPGIFMAGEMLDWEAPTGGYLIQGCVSQGHWIGRQLAQHYAAVMSTRA